MVDTPDELHRQAWAIARDTHRTVRETVTGPPVASVRTIVTSDEVWALATTNDRPVPSAV
jgi:hypothetical protein